MNPAWFFRVIGIKYRHFRERYRADRQRLPSGARLRTWGFWGAVTGLALCFLRLGGGWLGMALWGAGIGAASLPFIRAVKRIPPVRAHLYQGGAIMIITKIIAMVLIPYFSIVRVLQYLL